jgi:O-antigen ligase
VTPVAEPRSSLLLLGVTVVAMVAIPLFMYPGLEAFRYPKELLLRAEAIILAALGASWWVLGRLSIDRKAVLRKPWVLWMLSVLAWSSLTTLTSSNRLVSLWTLTYIAAMSVVFVATVAAAKGRGPWLAAVPLLPGIVNVVVLLLQQNGGTVVELTSTDARMRETALIGNPNDVGSYLMVVALAATALTLSSRRWRWFAAPVALVLIGGTFVSATLTAIGALLVGLTVLAAVRSWKLVVVAMALLALVVVMAVREVPSFQKRFGRAQAAFAAKDYDTLLSYRFTAFATAWTMAREHPLMGVGPGTYPWNYMEYRTKAEQRYPQIRRSGAREHMFGEAHNDHLQVLGQTGVPGYLLMAAGFVLCAMLSFRRGAPANDTERFARSIALPLAAALAVLALAQFPLELTSVLHTAATYAALALGWSGRS